MAKTTTPSPTRTTKRRHGVLCLEGDWWGFKDKTTVEPALQLLAANGELAFDYIHRDVGVVPELEHDLDKWVQKGLARYPILYLGFHGSPGHIYVGDKRQRDGKITLDWLEDRLAGKCAKRLIHFGSCGTLDVHGHRINRFLRRTEALAVCGYRADIDWLETAAFEIMLLAQLQRVAWHRGGMAVVKRRIRENAAGLERALKFRFEIG